MFKCLAVRHRYEDVQIQVTMNKKDRNIFQCSNKNVVTKSYKIKLTIGTIHLCGLSGQSSWLQIQRSVFDSRHYQIF
jgi:transcription elongation factor Elf1